MKLIKNKKNIAMLVGIIFGISILILITTNINKHTVIAKEDMKLKGQTISTSKFKILLQDYYYADYAIEEDLTYNFDKYLAVDLKITNTTDVPQKLSTLEHFQIEDSRKELINLTIEENYKSYSQLIPSNDSWNITLTFPVKESSEYYLYYNETLKTKDEKSEAFLLPNDNLQTKKVEETKEHKTYGKDSDEK